MKKLLTYLILLTLLTGFSLHTLAQDEDGLKVVATTTIIADVAQNVGGEFVEVTALVPANADTHAFQPTPADLVAVAEADVVLVNGAGLEEFLDELIENATDAQIVVVSEGVQVLGVGDSDDHGDEHDDDDHGDDHDDDDDDDDDHGDDHDDDDDHGDEHDDDDDHGDEHDDDDDHGDEHDDDDDHGDEHDDDDDHGDEHDDDDDHGDEHDEHPVSQVLYIGEYGVDVDCEVEGDHEEDAHAHGNCDPHVWTDPANVMIWANNIETIFATIDPDHYDHYIENAENYIESLEALDTEIQEMVGGIPEEQRILVTNHDFMSYFAAAYDFEIVGTVLPSVSTLAEPNPQELATLIELVESEGVPAIFGEISADSNLAEVVANEAGIVVVDTLYSGSLSEADGPAASYLDYMRYNTQVIVDALLGS